MSNTYLGMPGLKSAGLKSAGLKSAGLSTLNLQGITQKKLSSMDGMSGVSQASQAAEKLTGLLFQQLIQTMQDQVTALEGNDAQFEQEMMQSFIGEEFSKILAHKGYLIPISEAIEKTLLEQQEAPHQEQQL